MRIETFSALRDWLLVHTSLKSSRQKEGVSIEEKIVIFLYIVTRGASNRECCERFCYMSCFHNFSKHGSRLISIDLNGYRYSMSVLYSLGMNSYGGIRVCCNTRMVVVSIC